ncbi:hypothetical protein H9P43_000303 [Blastocladiella emersonii ATCC 22665]|nr:hypothetical protein H9P43_000303 [Blastocladiella emersonii ATCC 22665]
MSAASNPSTPGSELAGPIPFQFRLKQDEIDDLRRRLRATRWPDQLDGAEWEYGANLEKTKELADYWANQYDFQKHFDHINSFPHYVTTAVGTQIHFIHVPSERPDALPLLLIHGWPGSFTEFLDIIPLLTNPPTGEQAFHVVVPSLPGYGFSPAPAQKGFGTKLMARVFNQLMIKLGYIKYFAQGGDWGSVIARELAIHHNLNCVGIHINMVAVKPPMTLGWLPSMALTYAGRGQYVYSKEETQWLKETQEMISKHTAYMHMQAESPQTPAYALNDSPVGLLAWIYEKFMIWTHHQGDIKLAVTYDQLLTNISLYWFTQTIASSMRLYKETLKLDSNGSPVSEIMSKSISIPVGCAIFPKEIYKVPKSWAKHYMNVQHWTVLNRGGHFAALEEPALLAEDIRACFGDWVKRHVVQL